MVRFKFKSILFLLILWMVPVHAFSTVAPQLNQQHVRVTVIPDGFYLTVDDNLEFGGYLVEMLQAIAQRANFTYQLRTPSGFGDQCVPQWNATTTQNQVYSEHYYLQFDCGINDVNDLQDTPFASDLYLGLYYITPQRQLLNHFTMPFQPPHRATPVMVGTATGIRDIPHLIQLQQAGQQPPACSFGATALFSFLQTSYPELQLEPFYGSPSDVYDAMDDDVCPIFILQAFAAASYVYFQYQNDQCRAHGKPIGVIGEPMDFGLSHLGMGVGRHLDTTVVDTLSYWMNVLMIDGTLADLYQGGTGRECGYVLYPYSTENRYLSVGAIVGVTLGVVGLVVLVCLVWHRRVWKQQEARYKKRFVQQIARNIQIGPRPGSIPPEKLTEEILHIGQGKDFINKADLARWLMDIKMDFLSEKDFDALWNAMDMDDSGEVDAVEFIVFLSACGPEFEKVYNEQERLPKLERLKLAARRLSNLACLGEEGVHQLERQLESNSKRGPRTERRPSPGTRAPGQNRSSPPPSPIQDTKKIRSSQPDSGSWNAPNDTLLGRSADAGENLNKTNV